MADDSNSPHLFETPAEKAAREQTEEKRRENTQRTIQLWFNGVLATFTIVTAVAVIYQGIVMHDQLAEMHSNSDLTYHMALNAGNQAGAAKAQSEQAIKQTEKMAESLMKTDNLITQATTQATATNNLVNQAKRQTELAKTQLEFSERPWVGIQGPIDVIGSIHTYPSAVNFAYDLKNVGKSVALGVVTTIWLRSGSADGFSLMRSNYCEENAETERKYIAFEHEHKRTPTGETFILPDGVEHNQNTPQNDAPKISAENVYALFCTVYYDKFDTVHVTQSTYCFTGLFPGLENTAVICHEGNYAY